MAESFKDKRIKFKKSEQRLFIKKCGKKLGLTNRTLAKLFKISIRTLTDWKREKYLLPLTKAIELGKKSKIALPQKIKIEEPFWYVKIGAPKGGAAIYKKYGFVGGDPAKRKLAWARWWDTKGKNIRQKIMEPKLISIPPKNELLAEFTGIMIGDGGVSKTQITITLNNEDDIQYSFFVKKLVEKLFGVKPSIFNKKGAKALDIVVSRVKLVAFCNSIGLKIGNKIKQGLDIPDWVIKNPKYSKACLRGLMDTDGCVIIHKYKVNNKQYCYKKLSFCSASKPLIKSVIGMLKMFDFNPRLSHNGRNVWIDNQNEVKRYFQIINSSNPKHKERFLM